MLGWTGGPRLVPARIVWRTELGQQLPSERKARHVPVKQPNAVTWTAVGGARRVLLAAFGDDEMDDVFRDRR